MDINDIILYPKPKTEWSLRLEFGKSSSRDYSVVIRYANKWPKYTKETVSEKQEIHKLIFSENEILEFEKIYEKIKDWKTTKIFINEEYIEQKVLNGWLICYRDKLKDLKSNPWFCYGASGFTENIFGCHRAMFRERDSETWHEVGALQKDGAFGIDKKQLLTRIIGNLQPYKFCPALAVASIRKAFELIPDIIDPRVDKLWEYQVIPETRTIVGVRPISIKKRLGTEGAEEKGPGFTITLGYGINESVTPQFIKIMSDFKGISEKDYLIERLRTGHYGVSQTYVPLDSFAENKSQQTEKASTPSGCLTILFILIFIFFMFLLLKAC